MSVSKNSTRHRGQELISKLHNAVVAQVNRLNTQDYNQTEGDVRTIEDLLLRAKQRLEFLEMVVTGLTYIEMEDARDYAKFVEAKRYREDLSHEEFLEIIRR